jgi:hypothetical protein
MTIDEYNLLPQDIKSRVAYLAQQQGISYDQAYQSIKSAQMNTYDAGTGATGSATLTQMTKLKSPLRVEMIFKNDSNTDKPFSVFDKLDMRSKASPAGTYLNAIDGTHGANTHVFVRDYAAQRSIVISNMRIESSDAAAIKANKRIRLIDYRIDGKFEYIEIDAVGKFTVDAHNADSLEYKGNITTDGVHELQGIVPANTTLTLTLFVSAEETAFSSGNAK